MTGRRMIGLVLVLLGGAIAAGPLFFSPTDDGPFLLMLSDKTLGGDWVSHGAVATNGKGYTIAIEQKGTYGARGEWLADVATLTASTSSGETLVYRRTRNYGESGMTSQVIETPTRTTRSERVNGVTSETVESDTTPALERPMVRMTLHGAGALLAIVGVVLLVLPQRRRPLTSGQSQTGE